MSALRYIGGVAIALATTCASSVGLALQRSAHVRAAAKGSRVVAEPRFQVGLAFMACAALVGLLVVWLVGQAVSSVFAGVTVVRARQTGLRRHGGESATLWSASDGALSSSHVGFFNPDLF